jgi:hypothetical protein
MATPRCSISKLIPTGALLVLKVCLSVNSVYAAPYCAQNPDTKAIELQTAALALPSELIARFEALATELQNLNNSLVEKKNALVIYTGARAQSAISSESLVARLQKLKSPVLELVRDLHSTHRQFTKNIIDSYFQIAARTMHILTLENPYKASIANLQLIVGLPVQKSDLENIYLYGLSNLAGVDALKANLFSANSLRENEITTEYILTLPGETIYKSKQRAAAQSPQTRVDQQMAFIETAKCLASRQLIGRMTHNQFLLGQDLGQELSQNFGARGGLACLNVSRDEVANISKNHIANQNELFVRNKLVEYIGGPLQLLSNTAKEKLKDIIPTAQWPQVLISENSFFEMNAALRSAGKNPLTNEQIEQLRTEWLTANDQYLSANPGLEKLTQFWHSSEADQFLKKYLSTCSIDIYKKPEELQRHINYLQFISVHFFFTLLPENLRSLQKNLIFQNVNEVSQILNDFFIAHTQIVAHLAFATMLKEIAGPNQIDVDQTLAVLSQDLHPIVKHFIKANWNTETEKSIRAQAEHLVAWATPQNLKELPLKPILSTSIQTSKKIVKILDRNSDRSELPVVKSAVLDALSKGIEELSSDAKTHLLQLIEAKNHTQAQFLWKNLKPQLNLKVKNDNSQCSRFNLYSRVRNGLWAAFTNREYVKMRSAQKDCFFMNTIAAVFGYNEGESEPKDFNELTDRLFKQTGSAEDTLDFVYSYRESLAKDILDSQAALATPSSLIFSKTERLTLLKSPQLLVTDKPFYEILAELDDSDLQQAAVYYQSYLASNQKRLSELLDAVTSTKTLGDFDLLLKRTEFLSELFHANSTDLDVLAVKLNGINAFEHEITDILDGTEAGLEQNTLYPRLSRLYTQLRIKRLRDENVKEALHEIPNRLASTAFQIQFVSWATVGLSRLLGIPILAPLIHTHKGFIDPLLQGQFLFSTLLFAGDIPFQIAKYTHFSRSKSSLKELLINDAFEMSGLENPIPLIRREDYLSQEILFDEKMTEALKAGAWDTFFVVVGMPVFMTYLSKKLAKAATISSKYSNIKLEHASAAELAKLQSQIQIRISRLHRVIKNDLHTLGMNPQAHLSKASLQAARDARLYEHAQQVQSLGKSIDYKYVEKIEQAYSRSVIQVSQLLRSAEEAPNLRQLWVKGLLGPNGTKAEYDLLIAEGARLTRAQLDKLVRP